MFRNTITLCCEILNYQRESQIFFTSENAAIFHQLPSKHINYFIANHNNRIALCISLWQPWQKLLCVQHMQWSYYRCKLISNLCWYEYCVTLCISCLNAFCFFFITSDWSKAKAKVTRLCLMTYKPFCCSWKKVEIDKECRLLPK